MAKNKRDVEEYAKKFAKWQLNNLRRGLLFRSPPYCGHFSALNPKEVYKLWRERNPIARINLDAKALFNQKNILKAQRLTAVEIDEIRENIRLEIESTEDYTNEVNGDITDANGIELQKRQRKQKHWPW